MCLLVVFVLVRISTEPPFSSAPPPLSLALSLFYLSSASPSAGVSNIEIRNITVRGEQRGGKHSATRDKISAKRMHKILNLLRFEPADDDRPARINTDCHDKQ